MLLGQVKVKVARFAAPGELSHSVLTLGRRYCMCSF